MASTLLRELVLFGSLFGGLWILNVCLKFALSMLNKPSSRH